MKHYSQSATVLALHRFFLHYSTRIAAVFTFQVLRIIFESTSQKTPQRPEILHPVGPRDHLSLQELDIYKRGARQCLTTYPIMIRLAPVPDLFSGKKRMEDAILSCNSL